MEARETVLAGRDKGITCECCDQFCKVYKRRIHTTMARSLIWLHRYMLLRPDIGWVPTGAVGPRYIISGDFAKLEHWGLIREREKDPGDTMRKTSGFWQITPAGREFAVMRLIVPCHVYLYNNEITGWSNKKINIIDALGEKFDYQELING